jgi:hypothetical protein
MNKDIKMFWKIIRLDGSAEETISVLPIGTFGESKMREVLMRLAREGLTPLEIVEASMRNSARKYRPLLEVHKESPGPDTTGVKRFALSVGVSPTYVASIWKSAELQVP